MKRIVTVFTLLILIASAAKGPSTAHADPGPSDVVDAVIILTFIGGAAYLGYYFSEHYEVQKKAALEGEAERMRIKQSIVPVRAVDDGFLMNEEYRYTLRLININF